VANSDFVEDRLRVELKRLQTLLGLTQDLKVVCMPDTDKAVSGEVRDGTIYIYEADVAKAVQTLRHELLDYLVSQAVEPYREVTNRLIKMINEDAYKRKEKVVEALTRLITSC
jgi:hypothetical protein